jgi:ribose/xylose/arabinose/galactoside ABC-type transport system permease subunit
MARVETRTELQATEQMPLKWLNRSGPVLGLCLVCLIFGLLVGPQFFRMGNLELIARQTAIVAVAALGMTVVIASAGIDLSVGSVVSLSTVIIALLLRSGVPPIAAAVAAVGSGVLCGAIVGLLVTQLRLLPFIVTLGMMLVLRGAAKGLADEQRVEAPITWINELLRSPAGTQSWLLLPAGVWIIIALSLMTGAMLGYTRFGRHVFAIGSNERTARLCGVPIAACKVAVYSIGAGFAAFAGVLEFSKLSVGDPTVAVGLELDVIAAVIIGGGSLLGGRGSIFGTLIGATIMAVIQLGSSQRGLPNWVQEIVTGIIIILAVALDHWRQHGHNDSRY